MPGGARRARGSPRGVPQSLVEGHPGPSAATFRFPAPAPSPAALTACCPGARCLNVVESDSGGTTAPERHCSGSCPAWMACVAKCPKGARKPRAAPRSMAQPRLPPAPPRPRHHRHRHRHRPAGGTARAGPRRRHALARPRPSGGVWGPCLCSKILLTFSKHPPNAYSFFPER